jgi:hypothetical protein
LRPECSSTKGQWRSQWSSTPTGDFWGSKTVHESDFIPKTHWPIICDVEHSIVDEAWKLAIKYHYHHWALAGSPVGSQSVCQFPASPSLKSDMHTQEAVSFNFVFCFSNGLMMIIPEIYIVKTND